MFIVTNLTLPKGEKRPRWRAPPLPQGPGVKALSGGFSAARRGIIKCNFTAAPQAGKERFLCPFQIRVFFLSHRYGI